MRLGLDIDNRCGLYCRLCYDDLLLYGLNHRLFYGLNHRLFYYLGFCRNGLAHNNGLCLLDNYRSDRSFRNIYRLDYGCVLRNLCGCRSCLGCTAYNRYDNGSYHSLGCLRCYYCLGCLGCYCLGCLGCYCLGCLRCGLRCLSGYAYDCDLVACGFIYRSLNDRLNSYGLFLNVRPSGYGSCLRCYAILRSRCCLLCNDDGLINRSSVSELSGLITEYLCVGLLSLELNSLFNSPLVTSEIVVKINVVNSLNSLGSLVLAALLQHNEKDYKNYNKKNYANCEKNCGINLDA